MSQILSIIQEERLASINWDTRYILNVLNTIMHVLREHEDRLDAHDQQLPLLTEKTYSEHLNQQLIAMNSEVSHEFENTRKKIGKVESDVDRKLESLRTFVENESLAHLGEARRLITVELSNYVPTLSSSDPIVHSLTDKIGKMQREMDENAQKVARLADDVDERATPPMEARPASGQGAIRIPHLERRVDDIEKMIYTFPRVESDLRTLQLQFPAVCKNLDRKINELLAEKAKVDEETAAPPKPSRPTPPEPVRPPAETPPPQTWRTAPPPPPPQESPPRSRTPSSPSRPPITTTSPPPPPPKEDTLARTTPAVSPSNSGGGAAASNPVASQDTRPSAVRPAAEPQPVYTTDIRPSAKVLAELDWARSLIQQHHESIRSLQFAQRSMQEGLENLTDLVKKELAATSGRIAQVQGQLTTFQTANAHGHKQLSDTISAIAADLKALERARPPQPAAPPVPHEIHARVPRSMPEEPAPVPQQQPAAPKEPPAAEPVAQATQPRPSIARMAPLVQNAPPAPAREELGFITMGSLDRPLPGGPGRFILQTVHFSMNLGHYRAPSIASAINTAFPRSRLDRVTVADAPPGLPIADQPLPPDHLSVSGAAQATVQPQVAPATSGDRIWDVRDVQTSPADGGGSCQFQFRYSTPPRVAIISRRRPHPDLDLPFSQEVIEERVSTFARRVVTLLADGVKADLNREAAEFRKAADTMVSMMDQKIDREFVERMFNKFRVMLTELNEKIENLQCSFLEWVTRDELELVLSKFAAVVGDVQDSAVAHAPYECLVCGRKRLHVAGMLIGGDPPETGRPKTAVTQSAPRPRRPVPTAVDKEQLPATPTQKARNVVQFITTT
jgi:septal ring factor EnvC (AmiA/AmiB activator)